MNDITGADELLRFFEEMQEKARDISEAANGKNTIQEIEMAINVKNKPRQIPLKSEEDANLQAKDPRYAEPIDRAYILAEAIGDMLAGEK